jgi:hypothetical protein
MEGSVTRRSPRRWAARATLAVVALCVLSPGWLASAGAHDGFRIKGRAAGLIPGARGDLVLKIENPFGFAIVVHRVDVIAEDASNHCGADNLRSPGLISAVRIGAGDQVKVTVPIKLRAKAPPACEGASFPLSFSGRATRP